MTKRNRTDYREKNEYINVYDSSSGKIKKYTEKELGVTGLSIVLGKVREDTIKQLRGPNKIKILEEMVKYDPIIGAFNNMYKSMASSVKFKIKPKINEDFDDKTIERAQWQADFISSIFFEDLGHPFQESVQNALTTPQYGFSLQEPVYKMRDGKNSKFNDGFIGLKKIAPRYQGSIKEWGDKAFSDEINVIKQKDPNTFEEIPIPYDRLLHFTHRSTNNNPEGSSLYLNCVNSYLNKKFATDLELVRLQRGFDGLLTISGPAPIFDENTKNTSYKALQQWIKDTMNGIHSGNCVGIAHPEFLKVEIKSAGEGNMPDADKIIDRESRNIATALLADFFLVQQKSGNSAGFTSSKIKVFTNLVKEMLDEYCRVINHVLIPKLIMKNMMDVNLCPELAHTEIADLDLTNLMLFFQSFAKGYIPATKELANVTMDRLFGDDAPQFTDKQIDAMNFNREVQTVSSDDGTLAKEASETAREEN